MDPDSTTLATKILIVIFIILTIVLNGEFLFRYIRSPKVLYYPGHFGKIALALGSIFLAFFPYVIWAKQAYENGFHMSCRTYMTSVTYDHFFFPFVFGFTIVSTGLSLYLNQRQPSIFNVKLMSFALAVFPWVLALLIICPLSLAGTEWETCFQEHYYSRERAKHVIGILIPAIAALLFSIVLNVVTKTNSQQPIIRTHDTLAENSQNTDIHVTASNASPNMDLAMSSVETTKLVGSEETTVQPGISETTQSPHVFHKSHQGVPQQYPLQDSPQYTHQYPQQYPLQDPPQFTHQYPHQFLQQYPHQFPQHPQQDPYPYPPQYPQHYPHQYPQQYPHQHPHQQFPHCPPPIAQQSIQQQLQVTLSAGSVPQTTAVSAHLTAQQFAMEKRGLLLASLIFFFSVLPFSCFSLGHDLNDDLLYVEQPDLMNVIRHICIWIAFLYPVLVPIVWRRQVRM